MRVSVAALVAVVLCATAVAGLPIEQGTDAALLQVESEKKGFFDWLGGGTKPLPTIPKNVNEARVAGLVITGQWDKIKEFGEKAHKMYEYAKTAKAIYEAAEAMATAETDGEKLAAAGTFIKAAGELLPEALKPLEKFLEMYGEALEVAGRKIDRIIKVLEEKERDQRCIFRPGVMAGNWALYNWFFKACMGHTLPKMDNTMRKLLTDNRKVLKQLTGEDPIKYNFVVVPDDEHSRKWLAKAENWMVLQIMVWGYANNGAPMCTCSRPESGWDCPFCDPAPANVRQNPKLLD